MTRRQLLLRAGPAAFLLVWSGGFVFARIGLAYSGALTLLAVRYLFVVALLVPAVLIVRPRFPATRAGWVHLVAVALMVQVLYFGLSNVALKTDLSIGAIALVVSLQPVLVGLLAPRLVAERVSPRRWAGLLLGLAGGAVVILARSEIRSSTVGLLAAAGALAGITGGTLYERRFGIGHHPVASNFVQYLVGAAIVTPAALAFEGMRIDWSPPFVVSIAYLAIGNSLFSLTLLLAMVRSGGASRASALFFLVPPVSALIALVGLRESLPPVAWLGMAVATLGVAVASRESHDHRI